MFASDIPRFFSCADRDPLTGEVLLCRCRGCGVDVSPDVLGGHRCEKTACPVDTGAAMLAGYMPRVPRNPFARRRYR